MKSSYTILYFLAALLIVSCTELKSDQKNTTAVDFIYPTIVGASDHGKYIDTTKQLASKSYIQLKENFEKTKIEFSDIKMRREFLSSINDSLPYSISNKVKLYVDASQEFTVKFQESHFPLPAGIDEFGNKIMEYSPPYDSVKVFPAFIVNFTDSIQGIEHHDGKMIMIQEALNAKNEWQPIEYFSYSGCGNSYGIHMLETNSYMMFGVHKYKGDFKTKLRIRLKTNGQTIVSNEYPGYINKGQFDQDEQEHMHHNYLRDEK